MSIDDCILFKNLGPEQLSLIKPLFKLQNEHAGTVLFEQDDVASLLYIVIDGEVEINYKPDDGPALVVTRVHPENVVGWSAVTGNPVYTSSAICSTDCTLLYINGDDLRELCEIHPDICPIILDRLATMIAKRLQNTHNQVIELLKEGLRIKDFNKLPIKQLQEVTK